MKAVARPGLLYTVYIDLYWVRELRNFFPASI